MRRIPEKIRSDIRFSAFYLGNGTMLPHEGSILPNWDQDDYCDMLTEQPELIEGVINVLANVRRVWNEQSATTASERAAQWLFQVYKPAYQPPYPFEAWEIEALSDPPQLHDYFDAIKLFARRLWQKFPDEPVLKEHDYRPSLFLYGSLIERFFAVFCNVIQIDEQNRVLNLEDAMRRTAEFIRQSVDQSYQPTVLFAEWELELV